MKKISLVLLSIVFSISFANAQTITKPYDFPVKPGTTAWAKLKSTKEIYDATQIPIEILKNMTTEALVKTCLSYPNLLLMYAYNDFQKGFDELKNNFNGFQELMLRKDAGTELIKIYQQMNPMDLNKNWASEQQGGFVIRFNYIEVIISQYQILNSLNENEKKLLAKECLKKFDTKKINMDVFAIPGLETTGLIMGRILETKNLLQKSGDKVNFLETGRSNGEEQLIEIYNKAKAYVN